MIENIDHVIVVVEDLSSAEENYKKIFGIDPVWKGKHAELGTANVLFNFENAYFELLAANGPGIGADFINNTITEKGEGLSGLVLRTKDIAKFRDNIIKSGYPLSEVSNGHGISEQNQKREWLYQFLPYELTRGIFSFVIEHKSPDLPLLAPDQSSINKLEQVVIRTNDGDGFIKIYRDVFGIRLALDSFIEAWKKRILFFRLNKTTIEVIEDKDDENLTNDSLWGLAWGVKDIVQTRERLLSKNIQVSGINPGVKEDTLVATISSHTNNVPTLLIEHTKKA